MKRIDLNADLGEGFSFDKEMMKYLSSINVCCGEHAGSVALIDQTIANAKLHNLRIGAHPSYPDRENFGRVVIQINADELKKSLISQIERVIDLCQKYQVSLDYIKPHGALYNQANQDIDLAQLINQIIIELNHKHHLNLKLMGLANGLTISQAEKAGIETISEVFSDRNYLANYQLVPRTQAHAIIHDQTQAIENICRMVEHGEVTALDGTIIPINPQSICIHGDNQKALKFAQSIYKKLHDLNIQINSNHNIHLK